MCVHENNRLQVQQHLINKAALQSEPSASRTAHQDKASYLPDGHPAHGRVQDSGVGVGAHLGHEGEPLPPADTVLLNLLPVRTAGTHECLRTTLAAPSDPHSLLETIKMSHPGQALARTQTSLHAAGQHIGSSHALAVSPSHDQRVH